MVRVLNIRQKIGDWLLQKRWQPVLRRLQAELAKENAANRAMLASYARWVEGRADSREIAGANAQMRELLRTIGMGGLVILPFSPITIPWLVKVGERLNIRLLPDWFIRSAGMRKKPPGE